jgi:uncharacterized protein (DUF433 family)
MDWRDYIHSDPGIGNGKPVFKGTRFKVEFLLKLMGAGWDLGRIQYEYPGIEAEHLQAAAAFAAQMIHDEEAVAIGQAKAA